MESINVLFASAEVAPFAKVGGLGDVSGALPPALRDLAAGALDIRLIMPFHAAVKKVNPPHRLIGNFTFEANGRSIATGLYISEISDVPVYLLDNEYINHDSPVYHGDWTLDGLKYVTFSLAVLEALRYLDWKIDILHANDWHTALSVYALKTIYAKGPFFSGIKTVLSVHNLPFNGWGSQEAMNALGFEPSTDPDLPDWAKFTPLPLGLSAADKFLAVSPNYAKEILTPEFGCGLEEYLQKHSDKVMGILNGIDESQWDPATDKAISSNFSLDNIEGKFKNKLDLQKALGFEVNPEIPLMTTVSRLDRQKGIPSIFKVLPNLTNQPWQFALLGTGDPELERLANELSAQYPDRIACIVKYDDVIARMLYASGDIFLMPSLYEPCGLSQMFAMRYGNLPVATSTGGLADSILDYSTDLNSATGFLYPEKNEIGLEQALKLALKVYEDKISWAILRRNAMSAHFSWRLSATKYLDVYRKLLA
jgi:starch synthase